MALCTRVGGLQATVSRTPGMTYPVLSINRIFPNGSQVDRGESES